MGWFILGLVVGELAVLVILALFSANKDAEDLENAYYRTPQAVIEQPSENHEFIDLCCPTCKHIVNARLEDAKSPAFTEANYCDKCGQALDWGVYNGTVHRN